MSDMDPCPQCGGKLNATLAPLFGWQCPACHYVWLAKANEELNVEELRALLALAEENIEFEGERADKAEEENESLRDALKKQIDYAVQALGRVAFYEVWILKLADEIGLTIKAPSSDRRAQMEELRKAVLDMKAVDESTAKQLTEHAEAAGVDPDHIDYIDETTKAIVAMWAKNSELEARIKELERKNSGGIGEGKPDEDPWYKDA